MEVEALVSKIEAGSWPERVAAVRSVPNEFPGREAAGVYAEVARSVYVPNLAPSFHIVPWPPRFLDRDGFMAAYHVAAKATGNFSNPGPDQIAAALQADP